MPVPRGDPASLRQEGPRCNRLVPITPGRRNASSRGREGGKSHMLSHDILFTY